MLESVVMDSPVRGSEIKDDVGLGKYGWDEGPKTRFSVSTKVSSANAEVNPNDRTSNTARIE